MLGGIESVNRRLSNAKSLGFEAFKLNLIRSQLSTSLWVFDLSTNTLGKMTSLISVSVQSTKVVGDPEN